MGFVFLSFACNAPTIIACPSAWPSEPHKAFKAELDNGRCIAAYRAILERMCAGREEIYLAGVCVGKSARTMHWTQNSNREAGCGRFPASRLYCVEELRKLKGRLKAVDRHVLSLSRSTFEKDDLVSRELQLGGGLGPEGA